ncbi:PEGA domain-containing protein [Paludibaculum fermentans]|uniref:PEGA domain-containing protein n=1 Tax=Paludibaculum fermentans TaxID=1473598 RepID=A0A7S7SLY0_PALFE|nr:PEGA domain-containing protein [Paludibaculum fermentans]QOY89829.1 PEGA domain-containing protein [Paludibaculum fermentans]
MTENVEVNGKTVIDQGAPVTGTITVVEPRHRMGKDGKLEFSVDRVASVDGQPVELRSEKQGKKNEKGITGKTVSAITTAPLMSKKGKERAFEKGLILEVYTNAAIISKSQGAAPMVVNGAARSGTIAVPITSEPPGAEIEVDGMFVGSTPSTVKMAPGERVVRVKKGGLVWSRKLSLQDGVNITLHAILEEPRASAEPTATPVSDATAVRREPAPEPASTTPAVSKELPTDRSSQQSVFVQSKPWRITTLDRERNSISGAVELDDKPERILTDGHFVYLTHLKGKNTFRLIIVDAQRSVKVKEILLGSISWGIYSMALEPKRLVIWTEKREWRIDRTTHEFTTGDPTRNRVEKILKGDRALSFSKDTESKGMLGLGTAFLPQNMWIEDLNSAETAKTIDVGGHVMAWKTSRDEKLLYLLVRSVKPKAKELLPRGELKVFDVASAQLLRTTPVPDNAEDLFRFAEDGPLWLQTSGLIQKIGDEGTLASVKIPFPAGTRLNMVAPVKIDERRYAVTVGGQHKLAVLEIEGGQIEKTIPVGRESVRRSKATKRTLTAIAITVGTAAAAGGAVAGGAPSAPYLIMFPGGGSGYIDAVLGPDKDKLYVLDAESEDVTVLSVRDWSVSATVPVGKDPQGLWAPEGGHFIYCFNMKNLFVVNMDSNEAAEKMSLDKDERVSVDEKRKELLIMKQDGLDVLDALTSQRKLMVADLANARMRLTPSDSAWSAYGLGSQF